MAGFAAPCVGDKVKNASGLAKRLNAFLAVILALVGRFKDFRIVENAECLREIDLAEIPVFRALFFILNSMIPQDTPFVYTISSAKALLH